MSEEKPVYKAGEIETAVGDAIILKSEQYRAIIQQYSNFVCQLCQYPVFPVWQNCPSCGAFQVSAAMVAQRIRPRKL